MCEPSNVITEGDIGVPSLRLQRSHARLRMRAEFTTGVTLLFNRLRKHTVDRNRVDDIRETLDACFGTVHAELGYLSKRKWMPLANHCPRETDYSG